MEHPGLNSYVMYGYDSKLQCWSTVDPLAEKYYHDAVNLFKEGSKANARGFYNKHRVDSTYQPQIIKIIKSFYSF